MDTVLRRRRALPRLRPYSCGTAPDLNRLPPFAPLASGLQGTPAVGVFGFGYVYHTDGRSSNSKRWRRDSSRATGGRFAPVVPLRNDLVQPLGLLPSTGRHAGWPRDAQLRWPLVNRGVRIPRGSVRPRCCAGGMRWLGDYWERTDCRSRMRYLQRGGTSRTATAGSRRRGRHGGLRYRLLPGPGPEQA